MTPPWMPLYVADYLADTSHLSTLEHGAYLLLIMHYWQSGGLPADDRKLARIARLTPDEWADVRDTIAEFFEDGWRHERIDEEIANAEDKISKRIAAGKAGAAARHGKRNSKRTGKRTSDAQANASHPQSQPQPPSSGSNEPSEKPARGAPLVFEGKVIRLNAADFERWRQAYPNLDLRAELTALDDWYDENLDTAGRKKWFQRCSSALAKKNAERKAAAPAEDSGGGKYGWELTDEERLAQENYIRGCNGKPPKRMDGSIDFDAPLVTEKPAHLKALESPGGVCQPPDLPPFLDRRKAQAR